jgi:hypothetical protein
MWLKRKPKKTCTYKVEVTCYDNNSVRVTLSENIFIDKKNLLCVASNLEACAAQIRGEQAL